MTGNHANPYEEIVWGLREEGLDVAVGDDGLIHVGPWHRGDDAPPATVDLRGGGVQEYAAGLSCADDLASESDQLNHERFVLLLAEYLTTLHEGGDANLTVEVRLERDRRGRPVLREMQSSRRVRPSADMSHGASAWVADRDSGHSGE